MGLCAKDQLFLFNGEIWKQIDGNSMGGPKGEPIELPSICFHISPLNKNNWSLAHNSNALVKLSLSNITPSKLYSALPISLKIFSTNFSIVLSKGMFVKRDSTS